MTNTLKIGFIGGGNIARAIISGFCLTQSVDSNMIFVNDVNKEIKMALANDFGVNTNYLNHEIILNCNVIFVCIKPMYIKQLFAELKSILGKENHLANLLCGTDKVLISPCAGVTLQNLVNAIAECAEQKKHLRIIRCMPNTPLCIARGIWLVCKSKTAEWAADQVHLPFSEIVSLLENIGKVYEIDESQFSIGTAISGCAPGYVCTLLDSFAKGSEILGLSSSFSKELILRSMLGTTEMLLHTKEDFIEHQNKVATAGGATRAGIDVLENSNLYEIMFNCVKRSAEKCEELSMKD